MNSRSEMNKPLPEDFGTTQAELNSLKSRRENFQQAFSRWTEGFQKFALVAILLVTCFYTFWQTKSFFSSLIWGIVAALFGSVVLLMYVLVLGDVLSRIFRFFERRSSTFKAMENYEAAVAAFHLQVKKEEAEQQRRLEQFWWDLTGHQLEQEVATLYAKFGYETHVTQASGDEGIDIIMKKNGHITIVQCKGHKNPVGPHVVRDLYGTLHKVKADEAILVSLSGCTAGVLSYISDLPISIVCMKDIIDMQNQVLLVEGE